MEGRGEGGEEKERWKGAAAAAAEREEEEGWNTNLRLALEIHVRHYQLAVGQRDCIEVEVLWVNGEALREFVILDHRGEARAEHFGPVLFLWPFCLGGREEEEARWRGAKVGKMRRRGEERGEG